MLRTRAAPHPCAASPRSRSISKTHQTARASCAAQYGMSKFLARGSEFPMIQCDGPPLESRASARARQLLLVHMRSRCENSTELDRHGNNEAPFLTADACARLHVFRISEFWLAAVFGDEQIAKSLSAMRKSRAGKF